MTAPHRNRVLAIDVARALVIIGVVYAHTIDGLVRSKIVAATHGLAIANEALYIFRMPALAFLVGLFIPRAIAKRGEVGYLIERVVMMSYLYVLWYLAQGLAEVAAGGVKNTPLPLGSLLTVWVALAHLWFLPFLVVAAVVMTAAQPWRSVPRGLAATGGLLAVSVTLWGWNSGIIGLRGLSLLFFVSAGAWIGLDRLRLWMAGSSIAWMLAGLGAVGGFVALLQVADPVPSTLTASAPLGQTLVSLAAGALGTVGVLTASIGLAKLARVAGFLAALGRATLPIYRAHVILVAGARIAMARLGVDEPVWFVGVAVPVGVGVPFLVSRLVARRPWASWLFDLPAPVKQRLGRASAGRHAAAPVPAS